MLTTKRKLASVGEILIQEFMQPLGLTQGDLADAMGVPRKHVNQLCNDRRAIPARSAPVVVCALQVSPVIAAHKKHVTTGWRRKFSARRKLCTTYVFLYNQTDFLTDRDSNGYEVEEVGDKDEWTQELTHVDRLGLYKLGVCCAAFRLHVHRGARR
jgi:antitoxin HigA-1